MCNLNNYYGIMSLQDKINVFLKKNEIFKKPLEKIINIMLTTCKYINGESLERHNWNYNNLTKLKNIPSDFKLLSFEENLMNSLNLENNEQSVVELLWGDIQLGKRVHSCIIMWFSIYILKRPVLYVFRNLIIDQKQLQDDIIGTEKYNFNIQFIKNIFEEFNNELQEHLKETNIEYWKDFKLSELKDINSNDIIYKLGNKEAINSNDIICCLMNHKQLEKINSKFNEYIYYNNELVNITTLVDESDLMCPTSSNDRLNNNDKKDSSACEILLSKLYKKVKYALHITGTAHSLLYNITTRLNDNINIQIKISKVHKMNRINNYFGLFNNSITFDTSIIKPWWNYSDEDNFNKKNRYDIIKDYTINIKKIIETILKRSTSSYNSLLISEEKIRVNQFRLIDKIIKDFQNLFIIIYHGNCLRLYLSKNYENEIIHWSEWDSQQSITGHRLWQLGGVYGKSNDSEKSKTLFNNYCYYDICAKEINIKYVYKLLSILFKNSNISIINKTIITITGKYGDRGYSFTSDDYDNFSLHLTDQYFLSHASLNCTNISQSLRLQGKYNDLELKNGNRKLILWTTTILQDIIENFYIKFIKLIEKTIMNCNCWEEIKKLLEDIIDNGNFKFGNYMKYIDVIKKRKNIKVIKHYDVKHNGYKLITIDDMSDIDISNWCEKNNLPKYICINEIKTMNIEKYIEEYGNYKYCIPLKIEEKHIVNYDKNNIQNNFNIKNNISNVEEKKLIKKNLHESLSTQIKKIINYKLFTIKYINDDHYDIYNKIENAIKNNKKYSYFSGFKHQSYAVFIYSKYDIIHIIISENVKSLPCRYKTNQNIKIPYHIDENIVKYSVIKKEFSSKMIYINDNNEDIDNNEDMDNNNYINDNNEDMNDNNEDMNDNNEDIINNNEDIINNTNINTLHSKYYWKTPDNWLYLYDEDKPKIYSLNIIEPLNINKPK